MVRQKPNSHHEVLVFGGMNTPVSKRQQGLVGATLIWVWVIGSLTGGMLYEAEVEAGDGSRES